MNQQYNLFDIFQIIFLFQKKFIFLRGLGLTNKPEGRPKENRTSGEMCTMPQDYICCPRLVPNVRAAVSMLSCESVIENKKVTGRIVFSHWAPSFAQHCAELQSTQVHTSVPTMLVVQTVSTMRMMITHPSPQYINIGIYQGRMYTISSLWFIHLFFYFSTHQ